MNCRTPGLNRRQVTTNRQRSTTTLLPAGPGPTGVEGECLFRGGGGLPEVEGGVVGAIPQQPQGGNRGSESGWGAVTGGWGCGGGMITLLGQSEGWRSQQRSQQVSLPAGLHYPRGEGGTSPSLRAIGGGQDELAWPAHWMGLGVTLGIGGQRAVPSHDGPTNDSGSGSGTS